MFAELEGSGIGLASDEASSEDMAADKEFMHPRATVVLGHDGLDKVPPLGLSDLRLLFGLTDMLAIGTVVGHPLTIR